MDKSPERVSFCTFVSMPRLTLSLYLCSFADLYGGCYPTRETVLWVCRSKGGDDYVTLSLKVAGLGSFEDSRKCVVAVLVGAEHLTINCSIPFDHTWFSVMVSICCEEKLL